MNLARAVKKDGWLIYNGSNQKIRGFVEKNQLEVAKKVNFLPEELQKLLQRSWQENVKEIQLSDGFCFEQRENFIEGAA
jgi:hypothetical protein